MKRRSFLGFAGAACAPATLWMQPALAREVSGEATLPHWEAMATLGRRYLDRHPDQLESAFALLARLGPFWQRDRKHLRKLIAADMRRDLDAHHIVTIDGWVLPRTLVEVCSAVAIADQRHVC